MQVPAMVTAHRGKREAESATMRYERVKDISRAGNHGRRRHGKLRNDYPNVRKARAQIGDNRFGRFRRAAGAVENQVEAIAFEALADLHERLHVLVADGDQPRQCVPLQPPRRVEDDVPPGMSMKLDEVFPANAVEVGGCLLDSSARISLQMGMSRLPCPPAQPALEELVVVTRPGAFVAERYASSPRSFSCHPR